MEHGFIIAAGAIATTIVAAITVLKVIIPLFKRIWHSMFEAAHDQINDKLEKVAASLREVSSELKPNGGSSLRDAVNRQTHSLNYLKLYFKASMHTNNKAIFETNGEGHVVYVNRAFVKLTGFTEAQLMGMRWVNLIHPSNRDQVVERWMNAVKNNRDFDDTLIYQTPDGDPYQVHAIAYVIMDDNAPKGADKILGHLGEIIPAQIQT